MINLVIWNEDVTLDNGVWKTRDKVLNGILKYYTHEKLGKYVPFSDLALAELAIERLGGQIITVTGEPYLVKERIY